MTTKSTMLKEILQNKKSKKFLIIYASIGITIFIATMVYILISSIPKIDEFKAKSINGIVTKVSRSEINHGHIPIWINGVEYKELATGEFSIYNIILIGDSISKKAGSFKIEVYRKKDNDNWKFLNP